MNMIAQPEAVAVEDQDAQASKIYWTDEEREMLKLWLVEHFNSRKTSMDEWVATRRNLMMAQLEILSEERFRHYLVPKDVADMQARLDAHIQEEMHEKIISNHKAYVASHGMTPTAHAVQLTAEVSTLRAELAQVTSQLNESYASISKLEAEVAALRKQQPVAATTLKLPAQAAPKLVKPDVLVCASHLSVEQRAAVEECANVVWVESTHTQKDMPRLAKGRIALVSKGDCSTQLAKAIRASCTLYISVNGFSSLISSVRDLSSIPKAKKVA